ncbi:MAG: septal ring lytic transglycosylase RlpA family protein [Treponema sp.]|jgi:rare lipoprotein A|nr:septal ring lytic transglycosylase RlpA family protein [Treponema sp.]
MKRIISIMLTGLTLTALCSAQTAGEQFRQEGIASWYGAEFEGRLTASGETFNPLDLSAAHPNLPFGTMLKVTNKHNNKSVQVRVNDRGPFVAARIIDVSQAAAIQLDMISTGTAPVVIESLEPVPSAPAVTGTAASVPETVTSAPETAVRETEAAATTVPVRTVSTGTVLSKTAVELKGSFRQDSGKIYRLQVGSYKVARNAVEAFDKLKNAGLQPAYERFGEYFRVVLAGIPASAVPSTAEKISDAGFREALVREE